MSYSYSAREITQMAMDVEEASAGFYQGLADSSTEKKFKDVFRELSSQEAGHKRQFQTMAKDLADEDARHEYAIDIYNVMKRSTAELKKQRPLKFNDGKNGRLGAELDLAARAEQGAIDVYELMRDVFGKPYHKLLTDIIQVEEKHLKKVAGQKQTVVAE